MNSYKLAEAAQESTKSYRGILSADLVVNLQQGYIARWLNAQDESVRAKAATTACEALDLLHRA